MRPTFPSGPATRSAIYLLGLLAALKALSLVLMAQAVAAVLAGLMAHDPAWGQQLAWGMAGVVLRSLTTWAQSVAARRAALGVKEQLRSELVERALRTGTRGAGPSDGGLAILATRGLDALDSYYTQFLPALVNCAAVPLLLGARILFADWISAAVIVLTVPLVPVFMVLIGRYTEDRVREAQTALARLSGHMLELAKGLPVLVGLGRATAQRKALEDISDEYRIRTMATLRTAFLSALALELIATISVAVVAVFIGVRLVHGEMPLEAGLLALILAPDCYLPLRELGTAHHASDDGRAALAEATLVLDAPQAVPLDADHQRNDDGGGPPTVVVRDLAVVFSGRETPAVAPLSFEAAAGSITALDGVSGAGKSTVLGVLAGTVGTGGSTRVLGEIAGFYRANAAWVPQHPVMVAATVRDEVELYLTAAHKGVLPDADGVKESAERCLADVAAAHLADKHPAELSPGELRRVALARGLARIEAGATLLLLDEPTAHLDTETASVINQAILALRGRVTVVLVAHDPTTRELADRIVQVAHDARADTRGAALVAARPSVELSSGAASPAASSASSTGSVKRTSYIPAIAEGTGRGSTSRALRSLLAPEALKFTSAAIVGVLASLFAVALAGLSGWLIIRASEQPPILYLLTAIVGVRFFGIGRAVLRYCERLLLHDAVFAALTSLRGQLWESLSRRALAVRKLLQGGQVLGSVIDDVDTVRDLLPRVVLPPLTAIAVAAAAVLSTGLLLPAALPATAAAALVSLLASPLLVLLADRMSSRTEQRLRTGVLRDVAAALDARVELHANHAAGPVLSAIRDADRAATAASVRSAWAEGLGQALTVLACGGAALTSAVLAAPVVMTGSVEPATAAVVVLLQLALVEPYSAMATSVRQYPALRSVLQRISGTGVLAGSDGENPAGEDAPGVNPAGAAKTKEGLALVPVRAGEQAGIELDGLTAAWPGGLPVFEELSAVAEPGTWLAVTGASGSGKSTLLSAILGFLPARHGRVLVTGKVAWCPQEAHLFDSTIRGNLMLGLPASENNRSQSERAQREEAQRQTADTAMKAALAAVGLAPLVDRLTEGLDTRIGPSGSFLSGGERQRLAVARTLMAGADVILLDEPTAHLDAAAGRAMLADLRSGLKEKTVVLVSHNPADIHSTDHVVRLEEHAGRTTRAILARAGAGG